ncbi:MAG TPA: Gfo/Idh/MocA family oxidoreductase [Planctomycetaceae bacterium]|nr:Gfo/Idh/MocA family oxidoreductase [Planctomycetaceae bacterium]
MNASTRIGIACVGAGDWGKNQIRVFAALPSADLRYIVDVSPQAVAAMRSRYPDTTVTSDLKQVLADSAVRAVVIASPAPSHYVAARAALLAGKDVFIEKPMVLELKQGEELVELADRAGLLIQTGHLLLFHPAVAHLKELVHRGELGNLHYIYTQRLNLGTVRTEENALWSLAPHDISLANYLFDAEPTAVSAEGGRFLQQTIEDVAFLHLHYPNNRLAHIHVSWLDPHKTRRVTLVGSRKMAVFDDRDPSEKLRIYDRGVGGESYETFPESFNVRIGDIVIPNISNAEPLRLQAEHFVKCVATRSRPLVGGREGLSVVKTLQDADQLLKAHNDSEVTHSDTDVEPKRQKGR